MIGYIYKVSFVVLSCKYQNVVVLNEIYILLKYIIYLYLRNFKIDYTIMLFENRVLRGIFGPKREEVTGKWRKLHIEVLNYLYSSPNIIPVIK